MTPAVPQSTFTTRQVDALDAAFQGKAVGTIAQVVRTDDSAKATGTTTIPFDNTTPQNTEGDQYLSRAITPQFATSFLRVRAQGFFSHSAAGTPTIIMALFQDSGADALKTAAVTLPAAGAVVEPIIDYWVLAGSTAATTFKIRAGSASVGTTTFNGSGGNAEFNGTFNSFLEISEIRP